MRLWRIAAETRTYAADDLSGAGAAKSPGRWNGHGEKVIYGAPTISLAVLETVAHLDDAGLPQNRYLLALDVPTSVWAARETVTAEKLAVGWDAIPAGLTSVRVGSRWIRSMRSAVLLVPSAIVPEEPIALLNPLHPGAALVRATRVRRFEYQRLLRH